MFLKWEFLGKIFEQIPFCQKYAYDLAWQGFGKEFGKLLKNSTKQNKFADQKFHTLSYRLLAASSLSSHSISIIWQLALGSHICSCLCLLGCKFQSVICDFISFVLVNLFVCFILYQLLMRFYESPFYIYKNTTIFSLN